MSITSQLRAAIVFYGALLGSIAIYQLGLPGDFLLDDKVHLPLLADELTLQGLIDESRAHAIGEFGRHLSFFTFAFTEVTSGALPASYMQHNILLHGLTGCFVFWVLGSLLQTKAAANHFDNPWMVAAAVTALWLLHPLFVSTTLYIIQRMTILAALFTWIALLFYIKGRELLTGNRPVLGASCLLIGVPASFILGCMSKESAVLLPVYLFLLEWFIFPRLPDRQRARIIALLSRIALIGVPLIAGSLVFLLAQDRFLTGYAGREFTLLERLATQGHVIWWYIRIVFLPLVRDLSLYQDGFPIASVTNPAAWIAWFSLVFLFICCLAVRKRLILIPLCITMFLGSHLLESTIIPLELAFEHRNYLGAPFLLLAACAAYVRLHPGNRRASGIARHTPAGILATVALVFASQTALRTWTWSSGELLAMTAVQEQPESVRARVEVANFYLNRNAPEQAIEILQKSATIAPTQTGLPLHILTIRCIDGHDEEVLQKTVNALQTGRITAYTLSTFGLLSYVLRRGKCEDLGVDGFGKLLDTVLHRDDVVPRWRPYLNLLGTRTYAHFGKFESAMEYAQAGIESSLDAPIANRHRSYVDYAQISLELGRVQEAQWALQKLETLADDPRTAFEPELNTVRDLIKEKQDLLSQENP